MVKNYPTLKNLLPLFFLLFSIAAFSQTSQTFTTSGSFTVPAGVTQVTVEAWGGGGRGGPGTQSGAGGSGAGGGAYAKKNIVTVVSGNTYSVTVGTGSIDNTLPGGDSYFINSTTILAKGGNSVPTNIALGGLGGSAASSIGDVGFVFSGGNGVRGIDGPGNSGKDFGGGGGSSAGTLLAGTTATNQNGAIAPAGGGNGGNGGEYDVLGNGGNGSIPGGGGGGALWGYHPTNGTVYYGGNGANGQIIIRWTCPTYSLSSTVIAAPICVNTGAVVTLNSNPINLPTGTYTVTYNQSLSNAVTGATATMTVTTAGTGSFTTNNLVNSGPTTITITNLSSGSGTPNCSSVISANNTASVVVTDPSGAAGAISGSSTVCQGQSSVAYLVPAIANATSYSWAYSGTGATISGTTNSISINFAANATSGNLTVRGTNACGNGTVSANYAITVNPTSVGGTASSNQTICQGSSPANITLTGQTGTIQWQSSTDNVTFNNIAGATASPLTSAQMGALASTRYYRAFVTSGACTPLSSTTVTVTVNPLPAAPTGTASQSFCSGASPTVANLVATGTAIKWYAASSGGTALATSAALVNGTHYYASQTVSGCESSGRFDVTATVNTSPEALGPIEVTEAQCPSLTSKVYSISNVTGATTYNWTVPAGWLITAGLGTTSITVNIGSAGQDGNIIVSAQNFCASTVQTLTVTGKTINYWNGGDTAWNNAANWSNGVPSGSNKLDIVIPVVSSGEYPLLSNDISINNIEIQNGALLNVLNNGLTITGDLILNGKIDLHGESQLIQEMTSSLIICNNSLGSIEIDQQGTGNSFRYNYWSSPVNSNLARDKYTIGAVLKNGTNPVTPITFGASHTFAEQNINSSPIQLSTYWMYVLRNSNLGYSAWSRVAETGEVMVGEGFTMKGSNTSSDLQNYTFVGKPNNGDISLTLNLGFNYLVGNPYPSAIDAALFLWDNRNSILGGVIYFWEHYGGDTHNLAGYQGGYATRNLLDGTPASSAIPAGVSNLGSSVKGAPGPNIAVGQAFFVVGDLDGGNIQFKNSQRVFEKESDGYSIFMKNSNTKAKTENTQGADLRPKFRIGFDATKISHRQLLIGVDERATQGVDWGFDAVIYEVFADDMYWMLEGKKYVIQGTNAEGLNSSEFPLGIQLSKTGKVTVKIDALENVDDDTTIYLKDKVTGESFNMREKPVQLNLTAGKYADRFVLVFKTQKLVAEDVKAEVIIPASAQPIIEGIHVFMNNAIGELQIKNNSTEEIVSVALINSLGQTVKTWNSNFNIRTISLPLSTATGVYLVQINTKTGKTVKKISVE